MYIYRLGDFRMAFMVGELVFHDVFHLNEILLASNCLECPFTWLRGRTHAVGYGSATTILNMQLPVGCFQSYLKSIILNMVGNCKKTVRISHSLLAQGLRVTCY